MCFTPNLLISEILTRLYYGGDIIFQTKIISCVQSNENEYTRAALLRPRVSPLPRRDRKSFTPRVYTTGWKRNRKPSYVHPLSASKLTLFPPPAGYGVPRDYRLNSSLNIIASRHSSSRVSTITL